MVGMADGFAQASGRPTHVNLHTAPGVGNAVGGDLQRPGQQVAAADHRRPAGPPPDHLARPTSPTAKPCSGPQPYVKWSHEPPRAQDVPLAIARAIHHASLPPAGPAFVSIPMDDWGERGRRADASPSTLARTVDRPRAPPDPAPSRSSPAPAGGVQPGPVAGPDIDASGGWDAAVALAERQRLPVWATPATGGGRLGFPESHPNFLGVLPPGDRPRRRRRSTGHDLVLVVGSSVFPYYPYIPGPLLAERARARADHLRPRRGGAGADGRRRSWATSGWRWRALLELLGELRARARPQPPELPGEPGRGRTDQRLDGDGGAGRGLARGRHRRRRDALQHGRAAQPAAPVEARAATTSPPAAASASASPPRSASSSPSPSVRSSACSARARPSTASPRCGRPPPTGCRSPSWCCATRST